MPEQRAHRDTIELEHPQGVSATEQGEGLVVFKRQVLKDERVLAVAHDVVEGVVKNREVAQTKEVHLDEAKRLTRGVIELRDDCAVLLAPHDGDDVDEWVRRHDDARRVHSPLAFQAFETARKFRHLGGLRVRVDERPEIAAFVIPLVRLVKHSSQGHVPALHGFWVRLGQLLAKRVRLPQHAGRVLERLLRLDGAVRDNLRDFVFAVLFSDVANHFPAPTLVKVDIEVRL